MVALIFSHPMTFPQAVIEFIHEQIDRFIAFIFDHRRVNIGSVNDDMTFGDELMGVIMFPIVFELHFDPDNAFLVAK